MDIGDGMAVGICTVGGDHIQIDFGSQQTPVGWYPEVFARIEPAVFVLSHFHADHYNGLLAMEPHSSHWPWPKVREVLFPRIPEFTERLRFARCLFAISQRVLGGVSGSMELDFLNLFSRINKKPFTYRSLSAGETFSVSGSEFQVLWPPRAISDNSTIKVIREAISDFDTAIEEDEELRSIYKRFEEDGLLNAYFGEGQRERTIEPRTEELERGENFPSPPELKPSTIAANESLRAAANRFSLSFREDNRLLFLGDLEERELKQVVADLEDEHARRFQLLITPHHGTHWHPALSKLSCYFALSSVGPRLFKNLRPQYREISEQWFITYLDGTIDLPAFLPWEYRTWRRRRRLPAW
jgi:beta-lactamase superfamily II metal-dependent hydrolase